jgi:pimeloyl-ACP methyl ester carboxylesterase
MQQRLGRVTLADGTGLSYASVGAGRPLLYVMGWLTHLELSWELPAERAFYEALAQGCRLVRYDRAGCGLSDSTTRPVRWRSSSNSSPRSPRPSGPHRSI